MQFPESWLRNLVNPALDTAQLAHVLTMAGLEVEALTPAAPPFNNVVVAEILSAEKHPDADRLHVCQVDVGEAVPVTIVCGAPNAAAGLKVPCARPGAKLPGIRDQGGQGARRRVLRHAVFDQGTGPGRRGGWPDGAACRRAGGRGFPQLAQSGRHAHHPETHAQPCGLPVDAGAGARGRCDHRRRGATAADAEVATQIQDTVPVQVAASEACPLLSGAGGARHRCAGRHPALDGRAAGAQRHSSAAGAGRHHQLCAARTRPADACLRPVAPQWRHRGADGPCGRKPGTAERPDRRTRARHAGDCRCQRPGGAGRHHGRAADQRGALYRRPHAGGRLLCAGGDCRAGASPGPVHRFVAPFRTRRRFWRHPPGDGTRHRIAAADLRRSGRSDQRDRRHLAVTFADHAASAAPQARGRG